MNISSTLSNSYFTESSRRILIHENLYKSSMISATAEQFYYDYQYNPRPRPILNYSEYSTYDFNITNNYIPFQSTSSFIYPQEQMISLDETHINPYFRSQSSNEIVNEYSTAIEQRNNSLFSSQSRSRSRSRSPLRDQQVKKSSSKKRRERKIRKTYRGKLIREKELIFKKKSSLSSSKSKTNHSSSDRKEHKDEYLKRLYNEYSDESLHKQWKPLLLKECFELYQYAFDKYHGKSIDNKN